MGSNKCEAVGIQSHGVEDTARTEISSCADEVHNHSSSDDKCRWQPRKLHRITPNLSGDEIDGGKKR